MKQYLYIAAFVLAAGCSNNNTASEKASQLKDTQMSPANKDNTLLPVTNNAVAVKSLEDLITDTLMQLPFIKESNRHIDSLSHHKKSIAFIFDSSANEISVKAGYNGEDRFESYYNFTVDPKTRNIKVMDIISGDYLSVDEFIKQKKSTE
jgi:hypothetical protein